jgi:putative two-component system response regulator
MQSHAAVADVFDALTRDRPYREAMPMAAAASIMAEGRWSHFEPRSSTRS